MLTFKLAAIPEGHSSYEIEVMPRDMNLSENAEFTNPVHIHYDINRVGGEFFVKTSLKTNANLECDRCLDAYQLTIEEMVDMIFTMDQNMQTEDEQDVYVFSEGENEIDITDALRETLLIAIPFKKICDRACKGLCPHCGANWNRESCECDQTRIDPRWEALRALKFND